MTVAVYDFAPPTPPAERKAPATMRLFLPSWRGVLSLFRSAAPTWPEQSRPVLSSAVRDGGAPQRPVRRIRPAPRPLTAEDYAPKPVAAPKPADDIEVIRYILRQLPYGPYMDACAAINRHNKALPGELWRWANTGAAA